jgi:beta-mannanase
VSAGLSHAIIRLGHEANGTWYADSLGTTRSDLAGWATFWRRTALAMRSVPGSHFRFDWCVNAGVRNVPLASFYPGDDVVDFIGVDTYDSAATNGPGRVAGIFAKHDGPNEIAAFARRHRKPMSIPEWGVGPAGNQGAVGDDPAFVRSLGRFVRKHDVAYHGYFYSEIWGSEFNVADMSRRAYRSLLATGT